jgi:FKBP-type peptidyl-prolyl cis-trans isomerase
MIKGDDSNTTSSNQQEANVDNKLTGTKMQDFTPTSTPQAELQSTDIKVGDGAEVKPGDTITADYVGALMSDGTIFDASADHGGPVSFPLSGVIAGWSQGIPGMKVGGTRRLLIPASLGYGSQGTNGIPPNSDLVFDVTVTKIGQ